jgi:hypothetical protein
MENPKQKSQPWKELISSAKDTDICGITDRPWVRQQLASSYDDKVRGERQGRYQDYDGYRHADPFKYLYKAEGAFLCQKNLRITRQ